MSAIQLAGDVWLTAGEDLLGGANRITLLAKIAELGSITHAAKAAGMSYKTAWDAVEHMNNLAGEALVERSAGGKGGGGTQLTSRGQQLVANFQRLQQEHQKFIHYLSQQADGIADDYFLLGKIRMQSSARNQFSGSVSQIKTGAVNDEIELQIAGGHKLVATITRESTQNLGLALGVQATALIKASSIILVTDANDARFSARNQLTGTVSRVNTGAVNTEVVLELSGGASLAAIITNESSEVLELVAGKTATAIFKASSVIINR